MVVSTLAFTTCAPVVSQRAGARADEHGIPAARQVSPQVEPSSKPLHCQVPRATQNADPAPARLGSDELKLPRFFAALRELKANRRTDHVRVMWLGDSHTAADFWPHQLRIALQGRFGDGGPGFLYTGLKLYRHGSAAIAREGKWRSQPRAPATIIPSFDRRFGLGGIRMVPQSGGALVSLSLKEPGEGQLRWELLYRLPHARSSLQVSLGSQTETLSRAAADSEQGTLMQSVRLEGAAADSFRVSDFRNQPEVFGAIAERTAPGVVLDTLGINGARIKTTMVWNEGAWVREVRRRSPDLLIVAFGANEVGDRVAPWRYRADFKELVGRVRRGSPGCECLIVGPIERAARNWKPHPRMKPIEDMQRETARELGCEFFSSVDAMGGPGSLKTWSELSPQWARRDRVHLTVRGYRELGRRLADTVLTSFDAERSRRAAH